MNNRFIYNKKINFTGHESGSIKIAGYIILAFLAAVILGVLVWFGIVQRYSDISVLESVLAEKETAYKVAKNETEKLASLEEDYLRYSFSYLNEDEKLLADRKEILNITEKYLMTSSVVMKLIVDENKVSVSLYNVTMEQASFLMNALKSDSLGIIKHVSTKTAKNDVSINVGNNHLKIPAAEMNIILEKKNNE